LKKLIVIQKSRNPVHHLIQNGDVDRAQRLINSSKTRGESVGQISFSDEPTAT